MHVQPVSGQYVTVVVLVLQISRGADILCRMRFYELTLAETGIATPAGGRGPAQVLPRDCRGISDARDHGCTQDKTWEAQYPCEAQDKD